MNLVLLAPLGLAALAALLVPLLLHLRRRDERRPVDFAALRWLRQHPRPRFRLRMEEWPLLLLRLLLLALLALWLARPATTAVEASRHWTLLVPGVDPAPLLPPREGEQRRWLAPGFPPLQQAPAPADGHASLPSLLRQLDADLPAGDTVSVLVPARFAADGGPLQLSREVDWRVVRTPAVLPAADPAGPASGPALRLAVRHAGGVPGAHYLHAAATAWSDEAALPAATDAPPTGAAVDGAQSPWPADAQVRAWLGEGAMPSALQDWVAQGGTALLASGVDLPSTDAAPLVRWQDADGLPLIEELPSGRGRILRFTRALTAQAMPALLEADFPQHLHEALAPASPAASIADAGAYRPSAGASAFVPPPRDLRPWWALAIAALFLLERWFASARRRGGVA